MMFISICVELRNVEFCLDIHPIMNYIIMQCFFFCFAAISSKKMREKKTCLHLTLPKHFVIF